MGQARQRPLQERPVDIETDFHLWTSQQAELLRQHRFGELDLVNIIEELSSLGRSDRRALLSAYCVLILHLLKWQFQPERRGSSWEATIRTQRREIELIEADSPSLGAKVNEHVAWAYPRARADAASETGLPIATFPDACPYAPLHLTDFNWLPA